MNKFGIFIHTEYYNKKKQSEIIKNLNDNYDILFYGFDDQLQHLPSFVKKYECKDKVTLNSILVFGGDGTILRAKKYALLTKAPLLGINIGKLGFLSETKPELLEKSVQLLISNKFKVQSRLLLEIKVFRNKKLIYQDLALNDAVLFRANTPKMIEVKIRTNNRLIYTARCDGLVASTPTGSTAYSLSGGGPILDPLMDAIVLTPLNPHILSIRPVVFTSHDTLSFELLSCHDEPQLQVDGVNVGCLTKGDTVRITGAKRKVDFIKLSNQTFYQIMRRKMHMGRM